MSILRTCRVQLASENSGHVISISILAVVLVYVHEFEFISYWVNAGSGFRHDYVFVITMWSSYHLYSLNVGLAWSPVIL